YRDPKALPLARLRGGGRAVIDSRSTDRTVVTTDSPRATTLVLADRAYPGWGARVDGHAAPQKVVDGILRSVQVPAGTHEVVFASPRTWVRRGLGAGAAWAFGGVGGGVRLRQRGGAEAEAGEPAPPRPDAGAPPPVPQPEPTLVAPPRSSS